MVQNRVSLLSAVAVLLVLTVLIGGLEYQSTITGDVTDAEDDLQQYVVNRTVTDESLSFSHDNVRTVTITGSYHGNGTGEIYVDTGNESYLVYEATTSDNAITGNVIQEPGQPEPNESPETTITAQGENTTQEQSEEGDESADQVINTTNTTDNTTVNTNETLATNTTDEPPTNDSTDEPVVNATNTTQNASANHTAANTTQGNETDVTRNQTLSANTTSNISANTTSGETTNASAVNDTNTTQPNESVANDSTTIGGPSDNVTNATQNVSTNQTVVNETATNTTNVTSNVSTNASANKTNTTQPTNQTDTITTQPVNESQPSQTDSPDFQGACSETCTLPDINTTQLRFNGSFTITNISYAATEVELSHTEPIPDTTITANEATYVNASTYFTGDQGATYKLLQSPNLDFNASTNGGTITASTPGSYDTAIVATTDETFQTSNQFTVTVTNDSTTNTTNTSVNASNQTNTSQSLNASINATSNETLNTTANMTNQTTNQTSTCATNQCQYNNTCYDDGTTVANQTCHAGILLTDDQFTITSQGQTVLRLDADGDLLITDINQSCQPPSSPEWGLGGLTVTNQTACLTGTVNDDQATLPCQDCYKFNGGDNTVMTLNNGSLYTKGRFTTR